MSSIPKRERKITKPAMHADKSSGTRRRASARPLEGLRILVVDDDHAYGVSVRTLLKLWGAEVVLREAPDEGLHEVATERPDLILLDFDMPGMNGRQLAHAIGLVMDDPPPVFLISGRDLRSFDDPVPGVVRVFQKPFDPEQLLQAIQRHAHRRGASSERA